MFRLRAVEAVLSGVPVVRNWIFPAPEGRWTPALLAAAWKLVVATVILVALGIVPVVSTANPVHEPVEGEVQVSTVLKFSAKFPVERSK
jgi:hypothetical protein